MDLHKEDKLFICQRNWLFMETYLTFQLEILWWFLTNLNWSINSLKFQSRKISQYLRNIKESIRPGKFQWLRMDILECLEETVWFTCTLLTNLKCNRNYIHPAKKSWKSKVWSVGTSIKLDHQALKSTNHFLIQVLSRSRQNKNK